MRVFLVFTWAAVVVLTISLIIWTGYWLYFFLFREMREAMSIGIFPTLIDMAILVWLLMYMIPSQKKIRIHQP